MKNNVQAIAILLLGIYLISCAESKKQATKQINKSTKIEHSHKIMMDSEDKRISLNLNLMQQQHQLKNMRSHLAAVQKITLLLATDDYDKASEIAHTKLGLTPEMEKMCKMFGDENFEKIGFGFHNSADSMAMVFKNRNKQESLNALSNTLSYCVKCHATYRQ